jgi:hypothetical protein
MKLFFKSPNGRFSARLDQPRSYQPQAGQRKADALHYYRTIWLTDLRYSGRYFTGPALWSPDSRYFAAEEWQVTDTLEQASAQRNCRLVIFDMQHMLEAVVTVVEGGHIAPLQFEQDRLLCQKSGPASAAPQTVEIEMRQVTGWFPVGELT